MHSWHSRFLQHLAVLFVCLLPRAAFSAEPVTVSEAQITLAKERFQQATLAHARGAPSEAAQLFEEAGKLAPRAQAFFNAGISREASGESGRAADDFERALALGGLDEAETEAAQTRLKLLKQALAYLIVDEPAGGKISVGSGESVDIPARLHLSPGLALVRIEGPDGKLYSRQLQLSAGESETLRIEIDDPPARSVVLKRPAPPAISGSQHSTQAAPRRSQVSGTPSDPRATWGIVSLGSSAVLAGAAVLLGTQFTSANQAWDDSGWRDRSQERQARSLRLWTNVAWAGALAAGSAGTYFLVAPMVKF